jgi:hypothetical protein
MKYFTLCSSGVLVCAAALLAAPAEKAHKLQSVSMRKMADSLHSVIVANRNAYVRDVLPRLDARQREAVPAHAELLRTAARDIQLHGAEFSYTLRSTWPIHSANGPQTQVEQDALAAFAKGPQQPVYTEETLGGRSYFTAVYPDRASLQACVDCHNQHPRSSRHDFKLNDVIGAIVVRIPLEF